jgi:hypothetical protein
MLEIAGWAITIGVILGLFKLFPGVNWVAVYVCLAVAFMIAMIAFPSLAEQIATPDPGYELDRQNQPVSP